MARRLLVCRVCGREFVAPRFDAKTCTPTCRQRLRRGGDLGYLAGLGKRQQRAERKMHAAYDEAKATYRELVIANRAARAERRKLRQQKAEEERQRLLDQIVGAAYRETQQKQRQQAQLGGVAGVLKLFTNERRNDMSAEAIAAFLDSVHYPVEEVAERLTELKASGDYDRIIAEA
jgi:hypothetical protein